jgi:Ca2+-binding RTX toxin-like protein
MTTKKGDLMRRIALGCTTLAVLLLGATGAHASVVTSSGGVVYYIADQGEKNDVTVSSDTLFSGTVPVYTFKDNDAIPIAIGGGPCELATDGSAMCRQEFVGSFVIDLRDRDDTAQISTGGTSTIGPPRIGALIIGGRGVDVELGGLGNDILKGNDGRDSLRGREGADTYKGGRGRDTLQTLDGAKDTFISCGDGNDDFLRKDAVDPRGNHCEHSNHKNPSKP